MNTYFPTPIQGKYGELIVDDSISEKPFTNENEIINRHYDHGKEINFVSILYI